MTIVLILLFFTWRNGFAGEWADSVFSTLSLEAKVGQVLFPELRLSQADALTKAESLIREYGVGGFVLFGGRHPSTAQGLMRLGALSSLPLLITSDLERGAGQQIAGMTEFPPLMALGAAGDTLLAYRVGLVTALEAREAGIGMTFSPVLDVNTNPGNPIINVRSFGEDPSLVARLGESYMRGCREGGLLTTAKHFPGHGDTRVDSHSGLPVIAKSREDLEAAELFPFRKAIRWGVDAIMVGHLSVPALDSTGTPGSISRTIIEQFLRGEMGYGGLVVTDALTMDGVKNWRKGRVPCLLAREAGADILLMPEDVAICRDSLLAAFSRGRLDEKSLDASVMRTLLAKEKIFAPKGGKREPFRITWGGGLANRVAERSITLLDNKGGLIPLGESPGRVVSVTFGSTPSTASLTEFDGTMRETLGKGYEHFPLHEKADSSLRHAARASAKAADVLLILVASRVRAYAGYPGVPPELLPLLEEIAVPAKTIFVSLGNPYVITDLPDVAGTLLAYGTDAHSQRAAAAALLGKIPVSGKLPVTIPGRFNAGFGIELEMKGSDQ
jgi:beta-glucosidase-like glycosyl hydrolase